MIFDNIAKILNKLLKEDKVMTQAELANKLGISAVAVNKWLNGGSIESNKIPQLCEALNISPNELFGFKEDIDTAKALELYKAYLEHPEHHASINQLLGIK